MYIIKITKKVHGIGLFLLLWRLNDFYKRGSWRWKNLFCNRVRDMLGIITYSASDLISEQKRVAFSNDKLISDIEDNQKYLLDAIQEIRKSHNMYLLDGHLCLLDGEGAVVRVSAETFEKLQPRAIIILTEKPAIILGQRKERDGIKENYNAIDSFQREEIVYAQELTERLGIPLKISQGANDLMDALKFIQIIIKE